MGQLCLANKKEEEEDSSQYQINSNPTTRTPFEPNEMNQSPLSLAEEYGLGAFMTSAWNDKVLEEWENQYRAAEERMNHNEKVPQSKMPTDYEYHEIYQEFQSKKLEVEESKVSSSEKFVQSLSEFKKNKLMRQYQQSNNFLVTYDDYVVMNIAQEDQQRFRKLVAQGPIPRLRWSCWKLLFLYRNPIVQVTNYEAAQTQINSCMNMINKELHRTLVEHRFFHSANEIGQQQLARVLIGLSNQLINFKYCQGMNFLAGYLILVSGGDEIASYQSMVSLLLDPKHLYYYVFTSNLPLLSFMVKLISELVACLLPELHPSLSGLPSSFWSQKYVLTLFLDVVKIANALRLWDYIVVRGALVAVPELTLGILHCLKDKIMKDSDEHSLYNILNHSVDVQFIDSIQSLDFGIVVYLAKTKFQATQEHITSTLRKMEKENAKKYDDQLVWMLEHYFDQEDYHKREAKMIQLISPSNCSAKSRRFQ